MNTIYRALARCNTANVINFKDCLEEKLLHGSDGSFTCIVSPNHYSDFIDAVTKLQDSGRDYVWFYPVWESSDPKVPDAVAGHIRFVHIRK
jgi:hypothetical protein